MRSSDLNIKPASPVCVVNCALLTQAAAQNAKTISNASETDTEISDSESDSSGSDFPEPEVP